MHSTFQPFFLISLQRSTYLVVFLRLAASAFFLKLTVSSNNVIVFSDLLIISMSGLSKVGRMSAGIVHLLLLCPGIYIYKVTSSGFLLLSSIAKWLRMESWRQVKRPWSKAVLHQFKTCSRLAKFPHMSHLSSFLIPHLFMLSGVLRPFTEDFNAKDSTPLGILLMILFHPMLLFSSIRRLAKSPWNVNFLTLLFHNARVSSFIDLFPSFFALFIIATFLFVVFVLGD